MLVTTLNVLWYKISTDGMITLQTSVSAQNLWFWNLQLHQMSFHFLSRLSHINNTHRLYHDNVASHRPLVSNHLSKFSAQEMRTKTFYGDVLNLWTHSVDHGNGHIGCSQIQVSETISWERILKACMAGSRGLFEMLKNKFSHITTGFCVKCIQMCFQIYSCHMSKKCILPTCIDMYLKIWLYKHQGCMGPVTSPSASWEPCLEQCVVTEGEECKGPNQIGTFLG